MQHTEEASVKNVTDNNLLDSLQFGGIPTLDVGRLGATEPVNSADDESESEDEDGLHVGESLGAAFDDVLGDVPASIQQSIEALMHDAAVQEDDQFQLRVCFRDDEVRELYGEPQLSPARGADAGWDLRCPEDLTVLPGTTTFIDFGVAVSCVLDAMVPVPLLLLPRSSIVKTPLRQANSVGLIDAGYRGSIKAAVDHRGADAYEIKKGDRLFQLVAMQTQAMAWEAVTTLDETERGQGGFGSSGR
jgi:dUTP pyrophosphatase